MIVWRGLIEASYLEDARVGELLRQRGKTLEAIAYLLDLWRSYPNTASIESDFFGLSQVVAQTASQAFTNPALRRELAAAGITRSELLLQSIRMIQVFLSQSPKNPLADEASLALVGAFTELEDFKAVDRLAARFAKLYPKSTLLDSFQYSEALANFHLGQYDRAIEVAQTIARGDLQGRRRRRPAQPEQVAGALHPGPDLRRPPPARQGARILPPGRRPLQRRRRRDPVLHPQGPQGARGLGRPRPRTGPWSPASRRPRAASA